jgi:hypothetical protein
MPGCKPRVRVFRNMNGNPAGIPALPSDIGIRYGGQVPGTLALGTRYRINAEGRTPKAEPGHWTPVGEGRYDSAWDPGTTWTGSRDSCTTPCVAACPESPGRSTTSASGGKGKRYKLVTFSLLYPARHRRFAEGMQMEGPVLGWVSSWASWRLGPQTVFVERVEVEPPPPWADTMTWRTLSPVWVSTGRMPEGLCRPGRPRQGSGLGLDGSRHGGPAGVVERSGLTTLDGPRRSGSGLAGRPAGRGSAGTPAGQLQASIRRRTLRHLRHTVGMAVVPGRHYNPGPDNHLE